jgi:hypothetical protein
MRMRLRALVPALVLGGVLVAPPMAEADGNRRVDRGHRYGYERSDRGGHYRHRSYRRGDHRYYRGHRPHYRRYPHRPRHYHRPHYRPYWGPRRPYRPYYYAPPGYPFVPGPLYGPPPYRGGVHGSVSVGLPFVGFSLYF